MTGRYSSAFAREYHTESLPDSLEEDEEKKYARGEWKINLSMKNVL